MHSRAVTFRQQHGCRPMQPMTEHFGVINHQEANNQSWNASSLTDGSQVGALTLFLAGRRGCRGEVVPLHCHEMLGVAVLMIPQQHTILHWLRQTSMLAIARVKEEKGRPGVTPRSPSSFLSPSSNSKAKLWTSSPFPPCLWQITSSGARQSLHSRCVIAMPGFSVPRTAGGGT